MAIISFSLTEDALLSGRKTVTRRTWKPSHMQNWQTWFDEGRRTHDAYNKIPIAGGKRIARIHLTERPYWEKLSEMPESDLEKEGGMVDSLYGFYKLIDASPSTTVAVIRFEVIDKFPTADAE